MERRITEMEKRCWDKRYRRDRFWRIACGLVLAASLAGCADGQGAGDGARGTYEILTAVQVNGAEAPGGSGTGGSGQPGEESAGKADGDSMENTAGGSEEGSSRANAGQSEGDGSGESGGECPGAAGEPEITLVMVGDILLHTRVAESGRLEEGGYDFSAVFAEMQDEIQGADLALVNQEVIIGGAELGVTGYPSFNAPYELGDALAEAGFDVVLHATNHALDKGGRGIVNCLAFWEESYPDMAVLGIHGSEQEQQEIYVYEQDGIKIAILNYTYGTNGIPMPADMPYAVDMLERERVISDLRRARELADFVIVCPHWGTEYTLQETRAQREWAVLFAENGADLVLGTHPHVIEPIEWVTGNGTDADAGGPEAAEDAGKALVYYSLGNFVNWTSGTGEGVANRMVGGMARVTIGRDDAGRAVIRDYAVEPLVCHVEQGFGGVRVYPLSEYTVELAAENGIVSQDGIFSYDYCASLAEEIFGDIIFNMPDEAADARRE